MTRPFIFRTFREQAEAVLANIGGLTENDIAEAYDEWEKKTYPDILEGQTEALADLQDIGMNILLRKQGKLEEYEQRILRNIGLRDDNTNGISS